MGFRISWLAARSPKAPLLDGCGLIDTGELDAANEEPLSVAELPTGWTVLWANDEDRAGEARAAQLSAALGPVIAVDVNETCMHATAVLFDGGERRWRVHHEGDERIDFLATEGNLPPQAAAIEAEYRVRQATEDAGKAAVDWLFEIPLAVARDICGFKHDEWGEAVFTRVMAAEVPFRFPLSR